MGRRRFSIDLKTTHKESNLHWQASIMSHLIFPSLDKLKHPCSIVVPEWRVAHQQDVQDDPAGPNVGGKRVRFLPYHFRREIARGPSKTCEWKEDGMSVHVCACVCGTRKQGRGGGGGKEGGGEGASSFIYLGNKQVQCHTLLILNNWGHSHIKNFLKNGNSIPSRYYYSANFQWSAVSLQNSYFQFNGRTKLQTTKKSGKKEDDCNCRHKRSLPGHYCCFGKPSFRGKLHKHLCLSGIPSLLRKESLLDAFLYCKYCCRHEWCTMHNFCLLTSMELILIANCSLLYSYSNNLNIWKIKFTLKKEMLRQ